MALDPRENPALDFAALRAEGIALVQRLAGGTWTDHNTHDPGITILEQLCYALTDLGYRTQYELPDLLTIEGEDPYASLYTSAQILPISPVTVADLRKLVIDVPGVKNAWIEIVDEPLAEYNSAQAEVSYRVAKDAGQGAPAPSPNVSEIRVKGLYRVLIEKSDLADVAGGVIEREAARKLHRFRGLGQDFEAIEVLNTQAIRLDATLEIEAVDDAVALLANVYQDIAAYLSPSVPFHSLAEMLERGWRVDEVFEGPLLDHGFIDSEDLARIGRRDTLRISDLIRGLMAVPGVAAIKNLHFVHGGQPSKDWLLHVETGKTPRFDLQNSVIRLEKLGLRVDQGIETAARELFNTRAKKAASPGQISTAERDLRPRPGRDRSVASYYSVQQQFPTAYGVGAAGLSRSASPERKAQAKQLKAYLMFYDQLLANQFAQLANVAKLFSFHDETSDSYFCQPVPDDGTLGLDAVRVSRLDEHQKLLRQFTEDPSTSGGKPGARRRNRFLNHLLARFGEQFHDYSLLQSGIDAQDGSTPEERLARVKRAFLRDYPRIGRDRGTAMNYLEPATDDNISGLELALRLKLGVSDPEERFYVVEHILLRPIAGDGDQRAPLLRAAKTRDPYSLQVSFVFPDWGRYQPDNFKRLVEQAVREETPAHLMTYIVWKDETAMREFESAHGAWLDQLRKYRLADLGA
ncbi:MAG: hypothetical protein ACKVP5_24200 [Aestuariivirga sp.]